MYLDAVYIPPNLINYISIQPDKIWNEFIRSGKWLLKNTKILQMSQDMVEQHINNLSEQHIKNGNSEIGLELN